MQVSSQGIPSSSRYCADVYLDIDLSGWAILPSHAI